MRSRLIITWLIVLSGAVAVACAAPALAVDEPVGTLHNCNCHWQDINACDRCHEYPLSGTDGVSWFTAPGSDYVYIGPHGLYTSTTDRCDMCHTLHDAPTGFKLLPGATVTSTCFTCHDGTGGEGVYGTIKARTGVLNSPGHSLDTTSAIPGGSAATGGNAVVAFRGAGGMMSCSDCHSPHGSNVVAKFSGERLRIWTAMEPMRPAYSSKLLKQKPTGATTAVAEYGSDWCAGCHQGRTSGGMVMNHPVDSLKTRADPYVYGRIPLNRTFNAAAYRSGIPVLSNDVVIGTLGWMLTGSSRHEITPSDPAIPVSEQATGWLMKYPRVAQQVGHGPICQQCHEDSRDAGYLSADGSQAWIVGKYGTGPSADGQFDGANLARPRFQNFPHETENANLLVETGDNLCLNCHPTGVLP